MKEVILTEPITLKQTKHMPYLQNCLYEALRMHPAVGMSLPRVTPSGGVEIDGRKCPSLLPRRAPTDCDLDSHMGQPMGRVSKY